MRDPARIEQLQNRLRPVLAGAANIAAVYLFGSHGTAAQTAASDIDLGVVYRAQPELAEELALETAICKTLGTDRLDLVNLNKARIDLQFRVVREGEVVYCADETARADFVESVLNERGDYGITLELLKKDLLDGLREGRPDA